MNHSSSTDKKIEEKERGNSDIIKNERKTEEVKGIGR